MLPFSKGCGTATRGTAPSHIPIVAPEPGRPIKGIVLSADYIGVHVHGYGSSSRMCIAGRDDDGFIVDAAPCKHCQSGSQTRWYGYVEAIDVATSLRIAPRITPGCRGVLEEYLAEHGTLRGGELTLARVGASAKGKIRAEMKRSDRGAGRLPKPQKIEQTLFGVFRCGEDHGTEWLRAMLAAIDAAPPLPSAAAATVDSGPTAAVAAEANDAEIDGPIMLDDRSEIDAAIARIERRRQLRKRLDDAQTPHQDLPGQMTLDELIG